MPRAHPTDRVAAQAYSGFAEATVIELPKEVEAAEPVIVTITGNETSYGHLQIRLGNFAKATVVVSYTRSGTHAENVDYVLGDSASLTVVIVQTGPTTPLTSPSTTHCWAGTRSCAIQHAPWWPRRPHDRERPIR